MDPQNEEKRIMSELKEDVKKLEFFGVRHTLALMCFLGYIATFTMRVSLSVAIVAMTNSTKTNHTEEIGSDTCPYPPDYFSEEDEVHSNGEFNWSEITKGNILGSFYYGYILTNILGGAAADYWGGRYVMGGSIMLVAICSVVSPAAARVSSTLLIVLRVIQGIAAGLSLPAMNTLIAKWYPRNERSNFAAFIFSSTRMGTVVAMAISGWLCSSEYLGGWPSVFYVFGSLGLIWGVLWFILVRESAELHPRISDKELKYIIKGCPIATERLPVPWIPILTSKYVWAISLSHFGAAWSSLTLVTQLPTYFDTILHVKIENNGLLSALPFLASWICSVVFSFALNTLVTKNIISLLTMRRVAMVFGGYLPALIMISLCFIDCNKNLALAIFIMVGTCLGCPFSGVLNSHADIAPRFAGTVMGFANTIASFSGFASPLLTSYIINDNHTVSAWNKIFIIYAAINIITTTVYISFITTKIQPWNDPEKEDSKEIKQNNCEKEETS